MTQDKKLYVITNDGKQVEMEDWDWEADAPKKESSPVPSTMFDEEMMKLFQGEAS
jgi:hypothetical protein